MINLESFQEYIRDTSSPNIANLCLEAAKSKAYTAGVEVMESNPHYELFIYALAGYWYDNRSLMDIGEDSKDIQNMINSFVLELRHARDVRLI